MYVCNVCMYDEHIRIYPCIFALSAGVLAQGYYQFQSPLAAFVVRVQARFVLLAGTMASKSGTPIASPTVGAAAAPTVDTQQYDLTATDSLRSYKVPINVCNVCM